MPEIGILETVEALRHRETYRQGWHVHRHATEVHCVFSGAISYEFGTAHAPVTIAGGECLVIPRGIRHCAVATEGTPSVRLVVRLRTSQRIEPALAPFTTSELHAFFGALAAHPFEVWTLPPRALRAARDLHRSFEDGDELPFRRLAVWSFIAEVARAAAEVRPEARFVGDSPHAVVDTVCAYLRDHLAEHIRLRDLTRLTGYSERHLLNLFRARTGLTPGRYLARCRIDRAKELLKSSPSRPLVDVALACGFSSHSHFTEVFHRYVGETPSALGRT